MTAIDLDAPSPRPRGPRRRSVAAAALAVPLLIVALGLTGSHTPPPELRVTAQWLPGSERVPTALVWYEDGTREDVTARLGQREGWRPARSVRLVTVTAEVACEVWADGRLAVSDRSEARRYAVCAWSP